MPEQTQLTDVFVEMADTLVDDFDVIDFLHVLTERCVQLLGVSAAGLLLTATLPAALPPLDDPIPPDEVRGQVGSGR